jgi:hypothetical protein
LGRVGRIIGMEKRSLSLGAVSLLAMLVVLLGSPPEATLGSQVRLVYLHGAWVWTALLAFSASAGCGLVGLLRGASRLHRWSQAFGFVGILFWVTYLPMSLWTMQANWNGLYLSEPRWRIGVDFAIAGILLQAGARILDRPDWTSLVNVLFLTALIWSLANAEQVMHPPSPILNANSLAIPTFFLAILVLCIAAAFQLGKWIYLRSEGS